MADIAGQALFDARNHGPRPAVGLGDWDGEEEVVEREREELKRERYRGEQRAATAR